MKKTVLGSIAAAAVLLAALYLGYLWFFCRIYVPAGYMGVVTAKTGDAPAPGTILVEKGQKGIRREVLAEGRHFFDPIVYEVRVVPAVTIPLGKIGIITSKVGRELPPGEVIAPNRESKGVWRDPLGPGLYRLNPEGYDVEIVDAVNIPIGYVGVVTGQTGKAPRPGEFAADGEKGVRKDVLQPGLYYINRYAWQVNIFEVGMNQVTMSAGNNGSAVSARTRLNTANNALQQMETQTLNFQSQLRKEVAEKRMRFDRDARSARPMALSSGAPGAPGAPRGLRKSKAELSDAAQIFGLSRAVEFPSRDGFKVTLDMTLEFELMPENIARVYLLFGDLPQVVEKIIVPQVLSVSRLKGSTYRAQDFIMGEGRETFQLDLRKELAKVLASKHILVHNAIIRNVEIPGNILSPIQAVSLAREQNLTNVSLQERAKKEAELNTETELIDQRRREVEQETRKLTAQIAAEREQEIAGIRAETALSVANIRLKQATIEATTRQLLGEARVKADFLRNHEAAQGGVLKSRALGPGAFAEFRMIEALNPKVRTSVIYAGPGTLWTDLKNGTVPVK